MKKVILTLLIIASCSLTTRAQLTTIWERTLGDGNIGSWFKNDGKTSGFAYGNVNGNDRLYVVTRTDGYKVIILDANNGDYVGELSTSGISGGKYKISDVECSNDGQIFVCNYIDGGTFKVYRYLDESSNPEMIYSTETSASVGTKLGTYGSVDDNSFQLYYMPEDVKNCLVLKTADQGATFTLAFAPVGTQGFQPMTTRGPSSRYTNAIGTVPYRHYEAFNSSIPENSHAIRHIANVGADEYVATFEHGTNKEYAHIVKLPSHSAANAEIIHTTPSLYSNSNTPKSGDVDMKDNGNGTYTVYVLSTNNGIGAYQLFEVVPTAATIAEIQTTPDGLSGPSPMVGEYVETTGIVTAVDTTNGYTYIQDGAALWSGIRINGLATVISGDEIKVVGTVAEDGDNTEITYSSHQVLSSGNTLPDPLVISTLLVNNESCEGVLIKVEDAVCNYEAITTNGIWVVNDGTGDCNVSPSMYTYSAILNEKYDVTGIGLQNADGRWIAPREAADVDHIPPGPADVTIVELMTPENGTTGTSEYVGEEIITRGIVTAKNSDGIFIQDGNSLFSATFVESGDTTTAVLGDSVIVTGTLALNGDLHTVKTDVTVSIVTSGNPDPVPVEITFSEIRMQKYYYMLTKLTSVECVGDDLPDNSWEVTDGLGNMNVSNDLFDYTPIILNDYDITGVTKYDGTDTFIYPRILSDITDVTVSQELTIAEMMKPANGISGQSAFVGESVIITGVVTGKTDDGIFIQDADSLYSATFVESGDTTTAVLGDLVKATGQLTVDDSIHTVGVNVTVSIISSGNPDPLPLDISIAETELQKHYYMLTKLSGVQCVDTDTTNNRWEISDGSNEMYISDAMYEYDADILFTYDITGVTQHNGNIQYLYPRQASDVVDITPAPIQLTIQEIQTTPDGLAGPSPYDGTRVETYGIITAQGRLGFHIQNGDGEWSGVYVDYYPNFYDRGDSVKVTGFIQEKYNETIISNPVVEVLSQENDLPDPILVTTLSAQQEKYEGVYLRTENVTLISPDIGQDVWTLDDGSGILKVNKRYLHHITLAGTLYEFYQGVLIQKQDTMYLTLPAGSDYQQHYDWVSIADIQTTPDSLEGPSPLLDSLLYIKGVVMGRKDIHSSNSYIYVQDGPGAWNGIYVKKSNGYYFEGDSVQIKGKVMEDGGLTRIDAWSVYRKARDIEPHDSVEVTLAEASTEKYESVLVHVKELQCIDIINYYQFDAVDPNGDTVRVDRVCCKNDDLTAEFMRVYHVSGIMEKINGRWHIMPPHIENISWYDPILNLSISQIQTTSNAQEGPSPYEGRPVKTAGTVTAVFDSSFFLQQSEFAWNGIYVSGADNMPSLQDVVNVTGLVKEIDGVTTITDSEVELIVAGGTIPSPLVLTTNQANHESYEGVLIYIDSAKCVSKTDSSWMLDDGSGKIRIENWAVDYTPIVNQFYNVKASVYGGQGIKSIIPRDSSDIELLYVNPEPIVLDNWFETTIGGYSFMQADDNTRGMAYNADQSILYVVSRTGTPAIYMIDGGTGDSLGVLDMTGVAGGTYPINIVGVDDAGVIYAANLALSGENFKIYRWEDNNAAPTVAYNENVSVRLGDSFVVEGNGTGTTLYASGSGTGLVKVYSTADGLTYTETAEIPVTGGAARGGIAPVPVSKSMNYWINGSGTPLTLIDESGTVIYEFDSDLMSTAYHSVDFLRATNGNDYVAVSGGNSDPTSLTAEVWDVTNLNNVYLYATAELSGPLNANANGTGMVCLSENDGEVVVHTLLTNNGFGGFSNSIYYNPDPVLYAPVNVDAMSFGPHVLVNWNGSGDGEATMFSHNTGVVAGGLTQKRNHMYGAWFEVASLENPVLTHMEFAQGGFNLFNNHAEYRVHVLDVFAQSVLYISPVYSAYVPMEGYRWETVDLGGIDLTGVMIVAVLIEPRTKDMTNTMWPTICTDDVFPADSDGQYDYSDAASPFTGNVSAPSSMDHGSFLLDIYVTHDSSTAIAQNDKGGFSKPEVKSGNNAGWKVDSFELPKPSVKSFITGYKIYRGTDVSSMTQLITVEKSVRQYVDPEVPNGTYFYGVTALYDNLESEMSTYEIVHSFVDVDDEAGTPKEFALSQNYPNPFNPSTSIKYSIPEQSTVRISIINILGERVAELVNDVKEAGYYQVQFNASSISSGIYFYTIESNAIDSGKEFRQVKKMILMK